MLFLGPPDFVRVRLFIILGVLVRLFIRYHYLLACLVQLKEPIEGAEVLRAVIDRLVVFYDLNLVFLESLYYLVDLFVVQSLNIDFESVAEVLQLLGK